MYMMYMVFITYQEWENRERCFFLLFYFILNLIVGMIQHKLIKYINTMMMMMILYACNISNLIWIKNIYFISISILLSFVLLRFAVSLPSHWNQISFFISYFFYVCFFCLLGTVRKIFSYWKSILNLILFIYAEFIK